MKNPEDILKCFKAAGNSVEDLEDGIIGGFGFESGSAGYGGFYIRTLNGYKNDYLFDMFQKYKTNGPRVFESGDAFWDDDFHVTVLKLEGGAGFNVKRDFHEYIKGVSGADEFVVADAVTYLRRGDPVAFLAPLNSFFGHNGEDLQMHEWFKRYIDN